MFKHIVFQKFENKADALEASRLLLALKGTVPELLSMEVGINELDTERSFDLALIATFDSIDGYHAYEKHPAHKAVREFIRPRRSATASVDYTV